MGIFGIGDAFNSKHITAQIFSQDGNWYCVPLKKEQLIFDHFFVKIKSRYYVFLYDPTRVYSTKSLGSKSARTILYYASSVTALKPEEVSEFERFIVKNKVKRMTLQSAVLLSYAKARGLIQNLGKGKTPIPDPQKKVKENRLKENLVIDTDEVSERYLQEIPSEEQRQILRTEFDKAVELLGHKVNVSLSDPTPFLDSKLNDSPEMLAGGFLMTADLNREWKQIANPARGPFQHWLLILGIIGAVGIIAAIALLVSPDSPFSGNTLDDLIEAAKAGEPPPDSLTSQPRIIQTENSTITDFGSIPDIPNIPGLAFDPFSGDTP